KPANAIAQLNFGNGLAALGRRGEAIAAYRKAVELNPDFAEARLNLGTMLLERGDISEAIDQLNASVQLQPGSAEAQSMRGRAYQQKHLFFKAADCFRAALARQPDDVATRVRLALALAPHDADAAIAELRRALEDHPDSDTARSNLLVALHYRQHDRKVVF